MSNYAIWNLKVSTRSKVAGCGLEEEKWFLWTHIVELLDVVGVVSADSDNLEDTSLLLHDTNGKVKVLTFFPCFTN